MTSLSLWWRDLEVCTDAETHQRQRPFHPHNTTTQRCCRAGHYSFSIHSFSCPPQPLYSTPLLPCRLRAVTQAAVCGCSEQHGLGIDFLASKGRPPHPKALSSECWTQRQECGNILFSDYVSFCGCDWCECSFISDMHGQDLAVITPHCPAVPLFNFSRFYRYNIYQTTPGMKSSHFLPQKIVFCCCACFFLSE